MVYLSRFYGFFAGTGPWAFLAMALLSKFCLLVKLWELKAVVDEGETAARFGSSGTNAQDFQIVQTVSGVFFVFVLLCAAIMKVRNTEERIEFNKRFVRINNWCAENPEFVWLPGNDAPEGYDDAKEAQKAAS